MISYVIPTRDRPASLCATLDAIGALSPHPAEIIVVDNASAPRACVPQRLANGLSVSLIRNEYNEGAAARNTAVLAADPRSDWIVMLDDDSHPAHPGLLEALRDQPVDVAAVQAEVWLGGERPRRHDCGGLPEVFVGCGVAIRRCAYLEAHGYDRGFGYYAEEYDLAAKLLLAGGRVVLDRRFEVVHERTADGRSMNAILRRLVRNNAWVMQRYAPDSARRAEVARTLTRYGSIAVREGASAGYARGVLDLSWSLRRQKRSPMSRGLWDRFTGKAAAMAALEAAWRRRLFSTAVIVTPGKNVHVVEECLAELGVRIVGDEREADAVVIGTLSPGPILDAWAALSPERRLVAPWQPASRTPEIHIRIERSRLAAA